MSEGVEFTLGEFSCRQIIDSILSSNGKQRLPLCGLLVFIEPEHHQLHVGSENANLVILVFLVIHERDFINRNLDLRLLPYPRGIEQRVNAVIPFKG